jgi:archaeal flagellar protein FlaJ
LKTFKKSLKKNKKEQKHALKQIIVKKYTNISLKLFSKIFKDEQKNSVLNTKLKMADLKYSAEAYKCLQSMTTIITCIISLMLYYLIFNIVLNHSNWLLYFIGLSIVNTVVVFFYFFIIIKMKTSTRHIQTDKEMPFTLSELSVLASTGLTPIKIVRHMAQNAGSPIMKKEFRKIVHKIDIEGKDIVTAFGELAKETPSTNFRENLWDLANMIHQGGDLDMYLRGKADQTMQLRRDIQKEFIEKLTTYSEMYTSLVLVGVLFIGIAAFLLDAMSSSIGGLNAESLLLLLAYGIIPVAVIIVNLMISSAYSKSG